MTILLHPMWPVLEPYLVVEEYDRDGGHYDPRIRIELRDLPADLAITTADLITKCLACGAKIFPFRQRLGAPWSHLYYAPTCPLDKNIACSRGQEARDEYDRFKMYRKKKPTVVLQLVLL